MQKEIFSSVIACYADIPGFVEGVLKAEKRKKEKKEKWQQVIIFCIIIIHIVSDTSTKLCNIQHVNTFWPIMIPMHLCYSYNLFKTCGTHEKIPKILLMRSTKKDYSRGAYYVGLLFTTPNA